MAGGVPGLQRYAAGVDPFAVGQRPDDAWPQLVRQPRRQRRMAADFAVETFLQAVQAADVVAMAVGNQDGVNARPAQFGVIAQDLPGPGAVGFAGIDHRHAGRRVAGEVYLRSAGVHGAEPGRIFRDVGAEYVPGNLHIAQLAIAGSGPVITLDGVGSLAGCGGWGVGRKRPSFPALAPSFPTTSPSFPPAAYCHPLPPSFPSAACRHSRESGNPGLPGKSGRRL